MGLLDLGRLVVRIAADISQYQLGFKQAESILMASTARMARMGHHLTAALTLPLAGMGYAAARAFLTFDQEITRAFSLMTTRTPQVRKELEDTATLMSTKFPYSATEMGVALKEIAEAGLDTEKTLGSLESVARFATAGAFRDLDHVAKMMLQSQAALGLQSNNTAKHLMNLERVMNAVTVAANETLTNQENLSKALTTKSAAAMRYYNIEVEKGVAVLGAMAQQGVEAELAGERFDILLRDLNQSVIRSAGGWEELGLSIYNADKNLRPLTDIIKDLEQKLRPLNDEARSMLLTTLGFQFRSQAAIRTLIGMSGEMERVENAMGKASVATQEMADVRMQSWINKLILVKNELQNTAKATFYDLIPAIEYLADTVKKGLDWWNQLSAETRFWTVNIAAAVAVAGPLLSILGSMGWLFGGLIGTFNLVATGILSFGRGLLQLRGYLNSLLPAITGNWRLTWRWGNLIRVLTPTFYRWGMAMVQVARTAGGILAAGLQRTWLLMSGQVRLSAVLFRSWVNLKIGYVNFLRSITRGGTIWMALGQVVASTINAFNRLRRAMSSGNLTSTLANGLARLQTVLENFKTEIVALGVYLSYKLAKGIYETTDAIVAYREQLERAIRYQERWQALRDRQSSRAINAATNIEDPKARLAALEELQKKEQDRMATLRKDMDRTAKEAKNAGFWQNFLRKPVWQINVSEVAREIQFGELGKEAEFAATAYATQAESLTDIAEQVGKARKEVEALAAAEEEVAQRGNEGLIDIGLMEDATKAIEKMRKETELMLVPELDKPALEMQQFLADFKSLGEDSAVFKDLKAAYEAKLRAAEVEKATKDQADKDAELKKQAEDLKKSLRTPIEIFQDSVAELEQLGQFGVLTEDDVARAATKMGEDFTKAVEETINPDALKVKEPDIKLDFGLSGKQEQLLRLQATNTRKYDSDNAANLKKIAEKQEEARRQLVIVNEYLASLHLPEVKDPSQ